MMGFSSVLVVGDSGVVETVGILSSTQSICTFLKGLGPTSWQAIRTLF
ncbi:MAG: hypothetical protein NZ730_12575 [Porticoccaceae bacterium]|nr:hypothetical protein [Porticoccaceae bacterium]